MVCVKKSSRDRLFDDRQVAADGLPVLFGKQRHGGGP